MTDTESRRIDSFTSPRPADMQVHLHNGELLVELVETDVVAVVVAAVLDPDRRLAELIGSPADPAVAPEAVRKTQVQFEHGHLVVQAPSGRLKSVPLRIIVRAPYGSDVTLTGKKGRYTVTGPAAGVRATWDQGDLTTTGTVSGRTKLRADEGRVRLDQLAGAADLRVGTATLGVAHLGGATTITTGSGTVELGTVSADVSLTTGAGTVTVADAVAGSLTIKTGPGSIRIGVRPGVAAAAEISSRNGRTVNELPESPGDAPLRIDASSTSGDVTVTSA
ncbi:hypothetical protein [Actinoplanes sp. G11-F43]|uniref:hypothetical protein n=1 Tax=Actinoplanes sp. G11-F43 TaxID=3424130 RepID=UPI003D333B35